MALTRVGEAFEAIGAVPEALTAARRATQLPHAPPEAAALVGRLLVGMGDAAAAALTLRVAVARAPDSAALRLALGQALLATERATDAIEHVEAAVALAPDEPAVHRAHAQLHERLGNREAHIAALGRVASLDESDVSAAVALGTHLAQQGRRTEAVDMLVNASTRSPKSAQAQLALGSGFLQAQALPAAVRHLKEAIRLQPDLGEAHLRLGIALREAGALQDAIAALRRAALLAPENPAYHYQLGLALLDGGHPREAANVLIRAAAFSPHNDRIQDALTRALNQARTPAAPPPAPVVTGPRTDGRFTGDLRLFSVAELLDFLLNQRSTGTLIVNGPRGEGRIDLFQGAIVSARCPGSKSFSQLLLETDMVSHTDLKRAVVDPDDLDRDSVVATVVAANRLVEKSSLQELFERQVQEALLEMLEWQQGNAVFRRGVPSDFGLETPQILVDTRWVLIDTTRRLDERRARAGPAD